MSLKLRWAKSENQTSCSMWLLRKQVRCTLPSFVVTLSFKIRLPQRFMARLNGCRERCSDVNWSLSPRLEPTNKSPEANFSTKGTCFNSQSSVSDVNRVAKSRPFRQTPWDLISEKIWTAVSGKRQIIFWSHLIWTANLKYICQFER